MYGTVFAVPFVLLIVSSTMFFPYITGKNFTFRILVEIGFASWVLLALIDRDYRPRWSWITVAIASLVGAMFLSAIFGEYPTKSFWSNFERMEGWVTLAHFFMYFLVLGSVIKSEKLWSYFFNTALIAAVIMSLYAFSQIAGVSDVSQGTAWRVDGRLGNSSYLGVYMLFHMFIAAWLFVKTKSSNLRYLYGALFFIFGFVLLRTGTRGSTLGLVGGSVLAFSYLALMAPKRAAIKKWAAVGLVTMIVIAGGLWLARDTAFVKENAMLNRVANITLAEGNIRFTVWSVALEGVKERPLLGWGQENFSYVFNKYYDPSLYAAEIWYDRTHNIFFDWLIAGGVIGFLAYLSILAAALWQTVVLPAWSRVKRGIVDESHFSVTEQALLLGLLAAYMFHNLFVFDNLASWIFYAVVLALIHSKVSRSVTAVDNFSIDHGVWERIAVPTIIVSTIAVIFFVNVPGILAAKDIIRAYRQTTIEGRLEALKDADARGSFADQEIAEQMAQIGAQIVNNPDIDESDKAKVKKEVEEIFNKMLTNKPKDTRLHVVFAAFYRSAGDLDAAMEQLVLAEETSPQKQTIIEEQAIVFLIAGEYEKALERFKHAYELDMSDDRARVNYAVGALYVGDEELFNELVDFEELKKREGPGETHSRERLLYALVEGRLALQAAYHVKNYELVTYILAERVRLHPEDWSARVNLAASYFEQDDIKKAIEILEQAKKDVPSFQADADALIKEINSAQ